jgi:hypothetical protein
MTEYMVGFRVTIEGTHVVEAKSEADATRLFNTMDEAATEDLPVQWDATCELVDWESTTVTESGER